MDRGAWRATAHGVAKSQTWLSDDSCTLSWFTSLYRRNEHDTVNHLYSNKKQPSISQGNQPDPDTASSSGLWWCALSPLQGVMPGVCLWSPGVASLNAKTYENKSYLPRIYPIYNNWSGSRHHSKHSWWKRRRKSHSQPVYMMMTSCRTIYQEPTTIPPHHIHALGLNVNCLPYLEPFHAYSLGGVLSVEQTSTLCTQSLPNPWLDTVNSYLKMRVEKEVGGGIRMGNTCKPMADSFQCMTKFTTNKKK